MLLPRILTALVLVSVIAVCLFAENALGWQALVTLFIIVAWWEWINLANSRSLSLKTVISTALLPVCAYVFYSFELPVVSVVVMAVLWLILLTVTLQPKFQRMALFWSDVSKLFIGSIVLAFAWSSLIWFKQQPQGPWWILGFLLIIWLADSGAYFAGRRFGKNKLAPSVSPGKTIEGMLGGLSLVVIYVVILKVNLPVWLESYTVIPMAIIIAIVSVGGDLYESWLKRLCNIKDSGNILPGHGGVLDRIDSLIAALPFMVLSYHLLV